ncbi:hypothetical protein [Bifidobacterium sp. ESL0764]|uniref:FIVAR domain-containing protein n=1 Tax=Bifidobacterium sp. ESL0764 TaxID=2983228 RepID=UPI0023FA1FB9|nr:hypothetical protein [Bifidobacterium sp. ESL0764]WEV65625.1 hypothetical protein OZX71_07725 [Bifidobacterium sp. ESL0764]
MNDEAKSEQTADERGEKDVPPPAGPSSHTASPRAGEAPNEHDVVAAEGRSPFWKRRVVWMVVVALAVVVVAVVVGGMVWSRHVKDEALSGCRQQAGQIRHLAGTSLGKDAIEAGKVGKKDVADAKTWEALQGSQKKLAGLVREGVPACDATSRVAAQGQKSKAAALLKSMEKARANVEKSAKAVLVSRDIKVLKDTQDLLSAKVGQAKQLLDSSAGNVADDATRTALSQRIDAANGLLGSHKGKVADLQQTSQALDDAVNGVNASVQAKAEADAQAAAAAAAAQARAAQQQERNRQGQAAGGGSSALASPKHYPNEGAWDAYQKYLAEHPPKPICTDPNKFCPIG